MFIFAGANAGAELQWSVYGRKLGWALVRSAR
jgi:hypothetical protein